MIISSLIKVIHLMQAYQQHCFTNYYIGLVLVAYVLLVKNSHFTTVSREKKDIIMIC